MFLLGMILGKSKLVSKHSPVPFRLSRTFYGSKPSKMYHNSAISHNQQHKQASVYVHWPYCKSICPYCDFNRILLPTSPTQSSSKDSSDNAQLTVDLAMRKALTTELMTALEGLSTNQILSSPKQSFSTQPTKQPLFISSIFFGGGTPSLAEPETIASIIDIVRKQNGLNMNEVEITLEANPTSIEMNKLKDFKNAGVNRLSMGIQALNDTDLKLLGRNHSVEEALECYSLATSIFDKVSFDLIYGRNSMQTPELWRQELKKALAMGPTHMSLYSLTIEPGTPFFTMFQKKTLIPPTSSVQEELYDVTVEEMTKAGLEQYEVSNFGKIGYESRHNLNYWNFGDYIGIGPGAAGRWSLVKNIQQSRLYGSNQSIPSSYNTTRFSTINIKSVEKWKQQVASIGHGLAEFTELSIKESLYELFLTGLRTRFGVSLQTVVNLVSNSGAADNPSHSSQLNDKQSHERIFEDVSSHIDINQLQTLMNEGFAIIKKDQLSLTPKGLMVSDAILHKLLL